MTSDSTSPCPACGVAASGNFCQNCGTDLGGQFCNQCGEQLPTGSKFCGQCGTQLEPGAVRLGHAQPEGAAPSGSRGEGGSGAPRSPRPSAERRQAAREVVGGQNLPWWIAGVAMFILILFVGNSMVRPGPGPVPSTSGPVPSAGGGAATGGVAPDISNMSPIEAADRLFNRVMQATSAGDSAQAQAFLPMAIAAYQRARPLTLDGIFHLSMLNRTAMNLEAALDNALEILEQDPNHLLGLAAAAEAAIELGEPDEAEVHYRHLAAIYDAEVQRALPEYDQHSLIVDVLKEDAERFLAGR
jgi:hypothetical protein